jgi:hypothetical protein
VRDLLNAASNCKDEKGEGGNGVGDEEHADALINSVIPASGMTALHLATIAGNFQVVARLLKAR